MSIRTNIIGFLGIEAYDLILYLAKMLQYLGKKILVIDHSESGALTCCIPIPDTLDPKSEIISCLGMDFIKNRSALNFQRDYDYILIDFGFNINQKEIENCTFCCLVTDRQQHNIQRLAKLKLYQEASIIIKDTIRDDFADYLMEKLKDKKQWLKNCYYLYADERDKENMIGLQYHNNIHFKKQSGQLKYVLNQFIIETLHFDRYEALRAYKKAKRGA